MVNDKQAAIRPSDNYADSQSIWNTKDRNKERGILRYDIGSHTRVADTKRTSSNTQLVENTTTRSL